MSLRRGSAVLIPLLAGLCFGPADRTFAQPIAESGYSGLNVTLLAGFSPANPVFRPGAWAPVAVEVENVGELEVSGLLLVGPRSDDQVAPVRMQLPVSVAPGQRKIYRTVFQVPDFTEDLEVSLARGRRAFPLGSVGVRAMDLGERLVVVLGPLSKQYGWLNRYEEQEGREVSVLTAHTLERSDLLPAVVQGYDTVSALVWDGGDLDPLSEDQILALRQYVELGGNIVLCIGDQGDRINLPPWDDFLGAVPTGSDPFPIADRYTKDSSRGWSPSPLESRWAAASPISASSASRTAVLMASGDLAGEPCSWLDGTPMLYRRAMGAGSIWISRLAFEDWRQLGPPLEFAWVDFLKSLPPGPPVLARGLEPLRGEIERGLLGRLPSPLFVSGFLGLYTLLAVPVNYFFFRKRQRREMAWMFLPPLAVLFSVGAYYLGAIEQRGGVVQRSLLVGFAPYGSSLARSVSHIGVYSPTRRTFEFETDGPTILSPPAAAPNDPFTTASSIPFRVDAETGSAQPQIPPLLVHHWAAREFAVDHVLELGGPILVDATRTNKGFQVSIRNQSRRDVTHALLVVPPSTGEIGSATAGTVHHREIVELNPLEPSPVVHNRWRQWMSEAESFDELVEESARPHILNLPVLPQEIEERFMLHYSPQTSAERGVYALLTLGDEADVMRVQSDLVEESGARFLLTPIRLNRGTGGRDQALQPPEWEIRPGATSDPDVRIHQGRVEDMMYWASGDGSESPFEADKPLLVYSSRSSEVTGEVAYRPYQGLHGRLIADLNIGWATDELEPLPRSEYAPSFTAAEWWVRAPDRTGWIPLGIGSATNTYTKEHFPVIDELEFRFKASINELPDGSRHGGRRGCRLVLPQVRARLIQLNLP